MTCPCGSGAELANCCLPLIEGCSQAMTCESLMRSRYTAFAVEATDYLAATWHPASRPETIVLEPEIHWLGLKIIATHQGLAQHTTGTVEFVARSKKKGGRAHRLHEISRFVRKDGLWFYVDGDLNPPKSPTAVTPPQF